MLTAAISALLVGLLSMMGVKLSIAQIGIMVIVVKVVVVGGIMAVVAKVYAKQEEKPLQQPITEVTPLEAEATEPKV